MLTFASASVDILNSDLFCIGISCYLNMAHAKISDLYAKADAWVEHCPPFAGLYGAVGPAIAATTKSCAKIKSDTVALAQRSPLTFALFYDGAVHICHSLTKYPGDPITPMAVDTHAIVMIGNDTNASMPMVLDDSAFQRNAVQAKTITMIRGAQGQGATPAVLMMGPHGAREADTNEVQYWLLLLFPCKLAATALTKWQDLLSKQLK